MGMIWPNGTSLDFMQFPGMNSDVLGAEPQIELLPTAKLSEEVLDEQVLMANFELPSQGILIQLVELFFENYYHVFPCFHRNKFQEQVRDGTMQRDAPLVLYAICCISARYHTLGSIKQRTQDWYEQAKLSYQLTPREPWPGVRTLQAALLLTYHASTAGDFSSSWLFLGKAWRQAIALRLHKMDASGAASLGIVPTNINTSHEHSSRVGRLDDTSTIDEEECRRTLWVLLIMDRNHAWPTGCPNAISEIHFKVDIPVADSSLQAMTSATERNLNGRVPFTRNLGRLITTSSSMQGPVSIFHYICIAHIILGRVSELIHFLHDDPDTPEYDEAYEEIDSHMVKFRMSLPRQAVSVLEAAPEDRAHVVWLQIILNMCTILLHYRCVKDGAVVDASTRFMLAVIAARNTAQIVKDASRFSMDLLLSAHIGSSLYAAACILVIQWRLTNDSKLKDELDLLELVFERMDEVFLFLGLKFKLALAHDMKRSIENLEELRTRGMQGLLADCSKWTHVKEEMQRRGIMLEIT
jgi:hypothetical protein